MSKFFIDTEFIEGFHKPLFGKRRHFIDLISIGIVAEDGQEYFAISSEFNYKDADQWVRDSVIATLPLRLGKKEAISDFNKRCHPTGDYTGRWYDGKSNMQIGKEVLNFVYPNPLENKPIEFYGYYSDYDWVLFCSLFGRMIHLPKGFPMYCRDLKQSLDERQEKWCALSDEKRMAFCANRKLYSCEIDLSKLSNYPTHENEHSAIDDARWNKKLYDFLQTF